MNTEPLMEQCFVFTGIDTYSVYKLAFLACNASARTTNHGLTEHLIHHHGICTALLLIDELTSQQMKGGDGPTLMALTGLTTFPTTLRQLAGENGEWPCGDSVTAPAKRQYLAGLGQG